ncbi:MAG: alcohol dehydrogenase catalytic domain-containing protein, partial [Alphaproteobacteria bacterium]|nr:alcohol dehydrogenase catalytic domain-containing protein [Alphaproteobacteria bacterium]
MTKAIRIHETGGPEVLAYEDVEVGAPGPGEALLHQTAVGLNFIDIYYRLGLYPIPSMPVTLGVEAAGTVEAVGDGVSDIQPG